MNVLIPIMEEINEVVGKVDEKQMQDFCDAIKQAKRIFVFGEGRSGFSARGFAMRLMHLGFEVYFVGETIAPAITADDLFIGISGSGNSEHVLIDLQKAKALFCKLAGVTSKADSKLGKLVQTLLIVPGTVKGESGEGRKSIQLLSSLFDQCLHITLDGICLMLSQQQGISNEEATERHF